MPNLGLEIKRRCEICGKVFIIKTLDSLYCCKKCSDVAYARKKRAEAREKQLALIAKSVPKVREYLSIREAVAIYGVERDTLYLMVRRGQIPSINIGTRLTRIYRNVHAYFSDNDEVTMELEGIDLMVSDQEVMPMPIKDYREYRRSARRR